MKKLLIIMIMALCLAGCGTSEPEPTMYIVPGHYYTSGAVVTLDGNIWAYSQNIISEEPSYDNEPVYVLLYNAGTPNDLYDDEVVCLVGR